MVHIPLVAFSNSRSGQTKDFRIGRHTARRPPRPTRLDHAAGAGRGGPRHGKTRDTGQTRDTRKKSMDPARPVSNPYLDMVNPFRRQVPPHGEEVSRSLADAPPGLRQYLIEAYAWAIPTPEVLHTLATLAPLVEIGAGTGYWAWQLQQIDVDIVPYDAHAPIGPSDSGNLWHPGATSWTHIEIADSVASAAHPDRTLFLCWPPYREAMAADAVRAYQGATVAYIGEAKGGMTADDSFFELLERSWVRRQIVRVLRWEGFDDQLEVWERKSDFGSI